MLLDPSGRESIFFHWATRPLYSVLSTGKIEQVLTPRSWIEGLQSLLKRNLLSKNILVTGGAGFIGSSFIRLGLEKISWCSKIVNLDLLTYAADLRNLAGVDRDPRYLFVQGDVRDEVLVDRLCAEQGIDIIVHFAAETHVDWSIFGPRAFYETNVGGMLSILEVLRRHPHIHLHHISTDEVYGSLGEEGLFTEGFFRTNPTLPMQLPRQPPIILCERIPRLTGLSTTLSHCSNNFGPGQHVEKFIPRMISSCFHNAPLPVYGDGRHVRDWIFVEDHSSAGLVSS